MPIENSIKVKCAMCENESTQIQIISSMVFDYIDLDTRPSGTKRHKLAYDIQECPFCFYVNSNIGTKMEGIISENIKKKRDEIMLNNETHHAMNKFELSAKLYSDIGKYKKAGLLFLSSAWLYDDQLLTEYSQKMRKEAICCFEKYLTSNNDFDIAVLLLDLYRRTKQFLKCIESALSIKKTELESSVLHKIIEYQIQLCKNNDFESHNTLECLE